MCMAAGKAKFCVLFGQGMSWELAIFFFFYSSYVKIYRENVGLSP